MYPNATSPEIISPLFLQCSAKLTACSGVEQFLVYCIALFRAIHWEYKWGITVACGTYLFTHIKGALSQMQWCHSPYRKGTKYSTIMTQHSPNYVVCTSLYHTFAGTIDFFFVMLFICMLYTFPSMVSHSIPSYLSGYYFEQASLLKCAFKNSNICSVQFKTKILWCFLEFYWNEFHEFHKINWTTKNKSWKKILTSKCH